MRTGIIYKVTSPSGKIYIGKTIFAFEKRKYRHIYYALKKNSAVFNTKFSKAIRKYGDQLKWEILYNNVSEESLDIAEICAIYTFDSYNKGYNSTIGGEGITGLRHSDDSKNKMSFIKTQMYKNGLVLPTNFWEGKALSEITKTKMSISHKNRKFSEEHVRNIRKNHYQKDIFIEDIIEIIKSDCISQRQVARILNVDRRLIRRRIKKAGFLSWDEFKNKYL